MKNDLKVRTPMLHEWLTWNVFSMIELAQSCGDIESVGGETTEVARVKNGVHQRSRKIRRRAATDQRRYAKSGALMPSKPPITRLEYDAANAELEEFKQAIDV